MRIDRDDVILIGTAHVAQSSVDEVEETIRSTRPSKVLIELDSRRLEALQNPDAWLNMDIIQVLREKKQHMFLLQLYLGAMQARMGRETGVQPGMDMLRAVEVAEEVGAEVVLIDRDVSVTLKRGFSSMKFWQRVRLFWNVWTTALMPAKEEMSVEEMLEGDAVTQMTEEFAKFAPNIKTALIDERDAYMASHIKEHSGTIVAVVGAGHLPGIERNLDEGIAWKREDLDVVPPKRFSVAKAFAYLVPAVILGIFAYLIIQGDYETLKEATLAWILINGILSAIGAALAFGHPLAILTAFFAAPLTSLNPAVAAGWFAGLVQAKMVTPVVADFQKLKTLETMRDYWGNKVVRVLLVTALANLGSVAGTWIAGWQILEALA